MSRINKKTINCPVERTLNTIGKKWAVLIIRDLLFGKKRFGELLLSLSGISPRTLSARLNELEENKVIKKKVFPQVPLKVEYALTKRGKDLHFILDQMSKWGSSHKQ
ncbi:MAG: helix-turn-helix domain-containing protein [Patescibacteria group bacterium]